MGQFIETQSQLVSEAKLARLERQQEKTNKKNIELLKNNLKICLDTCFYTKTYFNKEKNIFYNFNNPKECYLHLLNTNSKDAIIYNIIPKQYWNNEKVIHEIDNIYMAQLRKVYQPYKEIYTEQEKELYRQRKEIQKQKQQQKKHKYDHLLNNGEELEPVKEKNKTWLLYGLSIPILAASCFIKNTIKPKKGKRRH